VTALLIQSVAYMLLQHRKGINSKQRYANLNSEIDFNLILIPRKPKKGAQSS
jgi:hypothetical protein